MRAQDARPTGRARRAIKTVCCKRFLARRQVNRKVIKPALNLLKGSRIFPPGERRSVGRAADLAYNNKSNAQFGLEIELLA